MANPEHLKILKKGVGVWNRWREEKLDIPPYYTEVDLSKADLSRCKLRGVNLVKVDLREANLSQADLSGGNLSHADLGNANLRNSSLIRTDLSRVNLNRSCLREANLSSANLTGANILEADISEASVGFTVFSNVDLRKVKGLDTVKHLGPSSIGIDTIQRSQGEIPEIFLRGVGLSDTFITYIASLTKEAIQYYSCFISYSSQDEAFAQRLHADLQQKGVRCWFAPEDMKIGDKIWLVIDQSIRVHDKLLLVLSEHSVNSQWVEQEVETTLARERNQDELVFFPVRLDDTVMEIDSGWPALIKNTRHIGDFSQWKDHDAYQQAFERLLRDLKSEG